MSGILTPLVYQFGLGGVGGFFIGYIAKKRTKIFAVIIGFFIIALLYLGYRGIISINYDELGEASKTALGGTGAAAEWLGTAVSVLSFTGSFLVGFLLGWKLG